MSAYERTHAMHEKARMDAFCAHTLPETRQRMSARTPPYPPVCVPPYRRARTRMGARVRAHTNRYFQGPGRPEGVPEPARPGTDVICAVLSGFEWLAQQTATPGRSGPR